MAAPGGRRRDLVAAVIWTAIATVLFAGFGHVSGRAVTRTLVAFGALGPDGEPLLLEVLRLLAGLGLLGVSAVYRRLAGAENAGSVAAWLAGWLLTASQGALLAARVSDALALTVLLGALAVWAALLVLRARRRPRGAA